MGGNSRNRYPVSFRELGHLYLFESVLSAHCARIFWESHSQQTKSNSLIARLTIIASSKVIGVDQKELCTYIPAALSGPQEV